MKGAARESSRRCSRRGTGRHITVETEEDWGDGDREGVQDCMCCTRPCDRKLSLIFYSILNDMFENSHQKPLIDGFTAHLPTLCMHSFYGLSIQLFTCSPSLTYYLCLLRLIDTIPFSVAFY